MKKKTKQRWLMAAAIMVILVLAMLQIMVRLALAEQRKWIRPFDETKVEWRISSKYGERSLRHGGDIVTKWHTGIDYAVPVGTEVKASRGGTVIFAEYAPGYGNLVIIDHGDGTTSYYGHNKGFFVLVSRDESKPTVVNQGDLIAKSGDTGNAAGFPHIHFEIRLKGVPQHPANYIFGRS